MPLVRNFGAWTTGGPAGGAPAPTPPPSGTGWTGGHACTPDNPCTYVPLPMLTGPAPQPTTARWSLSPGQKPPPAGEGWQGDPVVLPAPPPSNTDPFNAPSPAIAITYGPPGQQPPPGSSSGAPAGSKLFGLPPLLVIGAGGLLIFLIARRL